MRRANGKEAIRFFSREPGGAVVSLRFFKSARSGGVGHWPVLGGRKLLECASPLALSQARAEWKWSWHTCAGATRQSGRGLLDSKRRRRRDEYVAQRSGTRTALLSPALSSLRGRRGRKP